MLWVIDRTVVEEQIANLSGRVLPLCKDKKLILVFNKSDLPAPATSTALIGFPESIRTVFLSAKHKEGIEKLKTILAETADLSVLSSNDIVVTNMRHYEALTRSLDSIRRVQEGLSADLPGDLISQDLRECIFHLSDIAGEVTTDEVLGNIFKHFCVGK